VPPWICDKMKEIFNPIAANKLPPRRPGVDHAIETDGQVSRPKIYGLTRIEIEASRPTSTR
jgi:hypothetical protein